MKENQSKNHKINLNNKKRNKRENKK
jgi:hypothetical protein